MTSTQETENQQAEASVLWLAELKCPDCKDGLIEGDCDCSGETEQHMLTHFACKGTGAKYPQLREPTSIPVFNLDGVKVNWKPVSREKAGTELRKLEKFREYLHTQANDVRLDFYVPAEIGYCIEILCDDNLTIAAARKMEEGK